MFHLTPCVHDLFVQGQEQANLFKHLDEIVMSKCRKLDNAFSCLECGFQTKFITNMKNHVESKHLDQFVKIPCLYCDAHCPTRGAMRAHVKRQHSYKTLEF